MKYIRTKDGRIIDLEKFINEEKANLNYKSFRFNKIKKDGTLKWSAIGTGNCSIKEQIGIRCYFGGSFNSEIIKQADTIEELSDRFVVVEHGLDDPFSVDFEIAKTFIGKAKVYAAIWTSKGLIYKAKMKGILPDGEIDWELL